MAFLLVTFHHILVAVNGLPSPDLMDSHSRHPSYNLRILISISLLCLLRQYQLILSTKTMDDWIQRVIGDKGQFHRLLSQLACECCQDASKTGMTACWVVVPAGLSQQERGDWFENIKGTTRACVRCLFLVQGGSEGCSHEQRKEQPEVDEDQTPELTHVPNTRDEEPETADGDVSTSTIRDDRGQHPHSTDDDAVDLLVICKIAIKDYLRSATLTHHAVVFQTLRMLEAAGMGQDERYPAWVTALEQLKWCVRDWKKREARSANDGSEANSA